MGLNSAQREDVLLSPSSDELAILPSKISPLKGRKTMSRNVTARDVRKVHDHLSRMKSAPFTLTKPVPWPINPSEDLSRS